MAMPKLLKLLGSLLGGGEIRELRRKATEVSLRTKHALNRAKQNVVSTTQEVAQRQGEEQQAERELKRVAKRQAPKIVKALAREKRTRQVAERRLQRVRRLRSTLGAGHLATRGAHNQYKVARQTHQRAQHRLARERRPVERAQEKRTRARVATARAERRKNESDRLLRRREKDRAKAARQVREFKRPRPRPRRILEGLRGRDIGGAVARGAEAGGGIGAAVMGGGQALAGLSEGMAMAFGGPYGPLLKKGITMFTGFVDMGIKAGEALEKFKERTDAAALSYGHASPGMAAVAMEREFHDWIEDIKRGEPQANAERMRNRQRMERQRDERVAQINQDYKNRIQAARTEAVQRVRGQASEALIRGGHENMAYALNMWGVRHAVDFSVWAGTHAVEALGIEPREGKIGADFKRDMEALEEERKKAVEEARKEVEEERKQGPIDPNELGGYFKTIGEGSVVEEAIRMGMGGSWAEDAGLPNRFRGM